MLYAAIDNTDINSTRNKMVVLFISSNEIQEVPLLFLQYFLKVNGFSTIYLGYILSIRQLENICQHLNPAYIITTSAKKNTNKDLCAFVKKLSNTNSKSEFISIENKIKACDEEHYKYTNDIAETLDLLLGGKKLD
jgi:methanogenic corrinoid protein MtbC1